MTMHTFVEKLPWWTYKPLVKARRFTFSTSSKVMRVLPRTPFSPPRETVDTMESYARTNPDLATFYEIYPRGTKERKEPRHSGRLHLSFAADIRDAYVPAAGVGVIRNGRVVTEMGAIVTADGKLIEDVSDTANGLTHPLLSRLRMPPLQYRAGNIAVITTYAGNKPGKNNYAHWLFDILPRLHLLEKSDVKYDGIITPNDTRYQKETLKLLGIDKIIDDQGITIAAENLIVPSFPSRPAGHYQRWVIQYLRDSFIPLAPPMQKGQPRRIYISRAKATARRVLNEPVLFKALAPFGFVPVFMEDHSFLDGVRLMRDAEAIVAPHGAGTSNLLFCTAGVPVVEFFDPGYVNVCHWMAAEVAGLDYAYSLGEGKESEHYYIRKDITCNPDDIVALLLEMGLR